MSFTNKFYHRWFFCLREGPINCALGQFPSVQKENKQTNKHVFSSVFSCDILFIFNFFKKVKKVNKVNILYCLHFLLPNCFTWSIFLKEHDQIYPKTHYDVSDLHMVSYSHSPNSLLFIVREDIGHSVSFTEWKQGAKLFCKIAQQAVIMSLSPLVPIIIIKSTYRYRIVQGKTLEYFNIKIQKCLLT